MRRFFFCRDKTMCNFKIKCYSTTLFGKYNVLAVVFYCCGRKQVADCNYIKGMNSKTMFHVKQNRIRPPKCFM